MSIEVALKTLLDAGAQIVMPSPGGERRALALPEAGRVLGVKSDWFRDHMSEFPNAYRLPGGGQNGGAWRIPLRDLDAFERRRKVAR